MKVRVFNSLPNAGEWYIAVLPTFEFGRIKATFGYKGDVWLTFSWLFWQVQFSRE